MTRHDYVARLLDTYRGLPDTCGTTRAADRKLAEQLYRDRVPLPIVLAAFRLALSRRRARAAGAPSLGAIRSLHYFLPVIQEALTLPADYLDYICQGEPPSQHDGHLR